MKQKKYRLKKKENRSVRSMTWLSFPFRRLLVMASILGLIVSPIAMRGDKKPIPQGHVPAELKPFTIVRDAEAAMIIKNLELYNSSAGEWGKKQYETPKVFSFVENLIQEESELSPLHWITYNSEARYLSHLSIRAIYYTLEYLKGGKTPTVIKNATDWGSAFERVPYDYFFSNSEWPYNDRRWTYRDHSRLPHMSINYGLPRKRNGQKMNIKIDCADQQTRILDPNQPWLVLAPNLFGNIRKDAPRLEAEQVLPIALYCYTWLYDRETKTWDIEETKHYLQRMYLVYAGVELDKDAIEIVGTGVKTRFLYHGDTGDNKVITLWKQTKEQAKKSRHQGTRTVNFNAKKFKGISELPAPIVNQKKELCYFSSMRPEQSIIIPFSYIPKIEKSDMMMIANKTFASFEDIQGELAQVRQNQNTKTLPLYDTKGKIVGRDNLTPLIVDSERLRIIADATIGDATTYEEAVQRLYKFTLATMPYLSDNQGVDYRSIDINMPPLIAMLNGGDDCEGHATTFAALFLSSDHPILAGHNKRVGLLKTRYTDQRTKKSAGHVMSMINIPGRKTTTWNYPDHIQVQFGEEINNLFFIEATGLVNDDLGVSRPQERSYDPLQANIIYLSQGKRLHYAASFLEFKHDS